MKFSGENEVTVNFPREKEVMVKPPGGKEVIVFDEDQFSLATSINIAAIDWRAMPNAKKARRFSPNAKIRKVWIPKQYLIYKNNLAANESVCSQRKRKK